ncbi:hypothetical protein D3C76_1238050 [compost metagenome]
MINRCFNDILNTYDVCLYRFHRIVLACRNMFQGCRMKQIIDAFHRVVQSLLVPDIPNQISYVCILFKLLLQCELFTFIPTVYTDSFRMVG